MASIFDWTKELKLVLLILLGLPLVIYSCLKQILLLFVPRTWKHRKNLKGKTVLITGAGSGVGRQLAIEFSKYSTRLILLDLTKGPMLDTEKLLRPNTNTFVYECDVSNRQRVYEVAEIIKRDVGKVDILVNNAGIVSGNKFLDIPDEKIQKTMEVNALAHFWTCKAFLPGMVETNEGHIVSVASLAGMVGAVKLTDYCSSKFAAVGFMEALALELEAQKLDGVKVTIVCPTVITTGLFQGAESPYSASLTPEYVAQEIVQAVLEEKLMLLLPGWSSSLLAFKWMLPTDVCRYFMIGSGLLTVMDNFTGRSGQSTEVKHQ